jgi:hypothetical protein
LEISVFRYTSSANFVKMWGEFKRFIRNYMFLKLNCS